MIKKGVLHLIEDAGGPEEIEFEKEQAARSFKNASDKIRPKLQRQAFEAKRDANSLKTLYKEAKKRFLDGEDEYNPDEDERFKEFI
jgi:hypothetical protein